MRPRRLPDPVGLKVSEMDTPPDWDAEFGFGGPLELESLTFVSPARRSAGRGRN